MSKKRNARKRSPHPFQKVVEEQQVEKSNTLILAGVIIAICSIGLLIFVLSEKVFYLS
tara:strand:- start:456 stop:629 length:174 start_codon:yes stop_codon:yes gene_type:complete